MLQLTFSIGKIIMVVTNQINEPRWGAKNRDVKAQAILQTISHFLEIPLTQTTWLDIGCGSGGIVNAIAPKVKSIIGIDPEPWTRWTEFQATHTNLHFLNESVENLSCTDNSVDVIICNQVYEHVPNPQDLITEIYRILKPGGYCYFAGPNLLFPVEPHVFWPFVHWLPRKFAVKFMHFCGSKGILDAYSANYWTLKKWFSSFEIYNVIPYIIKNPDKYAKTAWWWKIMSYLPHYVLHALTWATPGFVFILRKPFD
ncbi:class I SAM-dependent methyltransferase [Thiotrichales bacterium HSG1]|nr:class I SAM-dependent methyltransferase [Thiotrichales bacterium HSG1]